MNRIFDFSIVVAVTLGLTACTTNRESTEEALDEISTARDGYWQAHLDGDADALAALVTEDATVMPPNAAPVEGREAIRSLAAGMFSAMTISDFGIEAQEVEFFGSTAIEIATYREILTMNGQEPAPVRGRYAIVWKRDEEGRWLVHRNMFQFLD